MENDVIHKTYSTEENGTFYEVNDKGRVEFWSDKHSESRIYDENERATETDKKARRLLHADFRQFPNGGGSFAD